METRTLTQVRIFKLLLNDMRSSKVETMSIAAVSERAGALEELIERESVAPYRDGQWGKTFKQGGLLEWYNGPLGFCGDGVHEEWVEAGWWKRYKKETTNHIEP